MSVPKPRKERKENADMRRRQLLEAARRSVVRHGLARTTLATVAKEAGLSQGVAVFYFKSKGGLLAETLRMHYQAYSETWQAALEKAGPSHRDRLMALIEADFSADVCSADALSVWFAFWGELKVTPQYAEIAQYFDQNRAQAVQDACRGVFKSASDEEIAEIAQWIDTLTDGFWQTQHLHPGRVSRRKAAASAKGFVVRLERSFGPN
jgi:TetR/AcrR family transcriptional repressor of bet genes